MTEWSPSRTLSSFLTLSPDAIWKMLIIIRLVVSKRMNLLMGCEILSHKLHKYSDWKIFQRFRDDHLLRSDWTILFENCPFFVLHSQLRNACLRNAKQFSASSLHCTTALRTLQKKEVMKEFHSFSYRIESLVFGVGWTIGNRYLWYMDGRKLLSDYCGYIFYSISRNVVRDLVAQMVGADSHSTLFFCSYFLWGPGNQAVQDCSHLFCEPLGHVSVLFPFVQAFIHTSCRHS